MVKIKNYEESETNNDQQNEHTIIVPDMQDVPNQVKENESNSVRDGQGAMKANQKKNWLFILRFWIYLAQV